MLLARVSGAEEAETAIAGGADLVELRGASLRAGGDAGTGAVEDFVATVGGRCLTSAFIGRLSEIGESGPDGRAILDCGLDFLSVAVTPGEGLSAAAGKTRLIGVVLADPDGDPGEIIPFLARAGFAGVMLDVGNPGGRLLSFCGIPALASLIRSARAEGLLVGLAGGLEPPDVPRLLQLGPDILGFGASLRDAAGRVDAGRVAAIRAQIPRASGSGSTVAGGRRDFQMIAQRIFVHDLVLPVRIGAYSDERSGSQQVRFDVIVELDPGAPEPTHMGEVLSYDLITDGIAAIVAEGHIDFAETLAERIAAHVLRQKRARRVTVKVEKLERGPAIVGVEFVAERSAGPDENR